LADALGVYDPRDGYAPHRALALPSAPGKVMLSPGESRAAAIGPFTLTVFDTESARVLAELPTFRSALADAEFLSDDVIAFAGENGLEAYDIAAGKSLWRAAPATSIAVSGDGARIAAVFGAEEEAVVYDRAGRELSRAAFGGRSMRVPADDGFLNPHDSVFALDADGGRLAVSFADGSLSVFDTDGGAETPVHPASRATHFDGVFYEDLFAYAVVEREPYASSYIVFDLRAGARRAHFSSDASHFVPRAAADGLYVAFENQVLRADAANGGAQPLFSAGGNVETFEKHGDDFMVCESAGPYRFVGKDSVKVYSSDYACRFADLGARFALTGSYDAKTVRILKKEDFAAADILRYAEDYAFSEAKIHASSDRAAFYSHTGLRLCDLKGVVVAETAFPEPLSVIDTQYDETSGNVAVMYADAFRLYSGRDASLILEKYGKKGSNSVVYAKFGVSVLDADGVVTLYDPATGEARASAVADPKAERALPIGGGLLTVREGRAFFDDREIGAGDVIGAGDLGGTRAFALSDGASGAVFSVPDGAAPRELFSFSTMGRAEAYFAGDLAFVSPLHGDASVYSRNGECLRVFAEKGYLAETGLLGDRVVASYIVAATSERYSLLLDAETSETVAALPGFLGAPDAETLILDDGAGRLRAAKLLSLRELTDMARLRLNGRELTPEETERFHAG
jgi:hypothetical protein